MTTKVEKAQQWANEALLTGGSRVFLTDFATKYIYAAAVPSREEVLAAWANCRCQFSLVLFAEGVRHSLPAIYIFALSECDRATDFVAFRVDSDEQVERLKYKRGFCPWLRYIYRLDD